MRTWFGSFALDYQTIKKLKSPNTWFDFRNVLQIQHFTLQLCFLCHTTLLFFHGQLGLSHHNWKQSFDTMGLVVSLEDICEWL
jgi:hypothetical protein